MKKIFLSLIIVMILVLVACTNKDENGNGVKLEANEGALVPYLDDGWVSVWNDEFDGDKLDLTKWNYETGGGGWGNNELQYYTHQNAVVSDGLLTITAKKEIYQNREYTSSRLTTQNKGDFKYGRIQVRAKLPEGRGTWPAIWMMPTDSVYGTWPNSGEIDIMEHVGYDMHTIHTTLHTNKYNHSQGTDVGYSKKLDNVSDEFHVYEIIWEPGEIRVFIDSKPLGTGVFRYTAAFNQDVEYYKAWPFDQEFFLILNIAVGGNWGGAQGVDTSIFPQSMQVDYVRVYEKDYKYYDKVNPSKVEFLSVANQLNHSIWWNPATDDMAVSYYEVYINGERKKTTEVNQMMLLNLGLVKDETYEIKVRAVDFKGNYGEFSDTLSYKAK